MARNTLRLDTTGFESMLQQLDELGGNVQKAVEEALENAAIAIEDDTENAVSDVRNLPAQGKYSQGDTKESIVKFSGVHWEGMVAYVPVGFDFSKPGAGGFLITGTPRMQPDQQLRKMYKQKRYMKQIQDEMGEVIMDYIVQTMEEG